MIFFSRPASNAKPLFVRMKTLPALGGLPRDTARRNTRCTQHFATLQAYLQRAILFYKGVLQG